MEPVTELIKQIPEAARNTLAIVAFLGVLVYLVLTYQKTRGLKILLEKIKDIPEKQRRDTIRDQLGSPVPEKISSRDYLTEKRYRYLFYSFLAMIGGTIVIIAMVMFSFYPPAPNPSGSSGQQIPVKPTPQPGDQLLFDNFENPAAARLPLSSDEPEHFETGYRDGKYLVRSKLPLEQWNFMPLVYPPGIYDNASISISGVIGGDPKNKYLSLGCRNQQSGSHYRLEVYPEDGTYLISYWDRQAENILTKRQNNPVISTGNQPNVLELACVGKNILASVNGVLIENKTDDRLREGGFWFGVGAPSEVEISGLPEARFDDLVITKR